MLKRVLIVLLVIGTMSVSILTVASYQTNSCELAPQLKQTDDDFESYREFIALPMRSRKMALNS